MPRIELTNEEYEIIQRKRENERFYRAGKQEAFNEIFDFMERGENGVPPTHNETLAFLIEQKGKLT